MKITAIVAMARNRVIGANGRMPWHLPADLRRFRAITWGKPILMGRKTYEAIGHPLPGRHNIIISRSPDFHAEGCSVANSIAGGLALATTEEIMVIGGAGIYQALLPRCDSLHLTLIHADFEGDILFPEWDASLWREIDRVDYPAGEEGFPYPYSFIELSRR